MAVNKQIDINPARRIICSPEWEELGVVFDTHSGDFWIVSNEVRAALLSATASCLDEGKQDLTEEIRERLVAYDIIQPSR